MMWFEASDITTFPDVETALSEPDGLLACGGNLSKTTLLSAYRCGIFPWFSDGEPIMWWSPSLRAVIATDHVHISKNMAKLMRQQRVEVSFDTDFSAVIARCALPSPVDCREQTWITPQMQRAYQCLHDEGYAHSVEIRDKNNQLIGGLYGVFINNCFCGESMFSEQSNASKLALIYLAQFLHHFGCEVIDCQMPTTHLLTMGAQTMPRKTFCDMIKKQNTNSALYGKSWRDLWRPY